VEENQDLVLIMNDYTTGVYSYDMKMYVPDGYCGYFNLQKTSTPGEEWAFQIYYQTNGDAVADAGAAAALTHSFNHDEWFDIKVIVDLDNDLATYYFNGEAMITYQWTLGTFGTAGLLQFGGVNIFGGANSTQPTDVPMFYFDDVSLSELQDVTGYNVYLDGVLESTVGNNVLEYMYTDLVQGEEYVAGVSALYADGESPIVEVQFTYSPVAGFSPPTNPAATVEDYNDVLVTWEVPGGGNLRSLSGFKVYRDGVEIAEITNTTTLLYIDECLDEGTYEYTITAIYSYPPGESIPTIPVEATIVLDPPINAEANCQPPNIIITWEAPNRGIESYNVYRDSVEIASGVTGLMHIDIAVPPGTYVYNVTAVYDGGYESEFSNDAWTGSGPATDPNLMPFVTALYDNYPNPFNPETTISFSTTEAELNTQITIYNLKGQKIKQLINEVLPVGVHSVIWDGTDENNKKVSSGVYLYKMQTGKFEKTKKMILMK